jgi:hypothetical protein
MEATHRRGIAGFRVRGGRSSRTGNLTLAAALGLGQNKRPYGQFSESMQLGQCSWRLKRGLSVHEIRAEVGRVRSIREGGEAGKTSSRRRPNATRYCGSAGGFALVIR